MTPLDPDEINALLARHAPGGTVYLIGAGGCGMSGLGHLLLDLGFGVAGSDLVLNSEVRQLQSRGASIQQGHSSAALQAKRPFLVVYSSAIPLDNPEIQAAHESAIPMVRRAWLLASLLRRQRGICVAGMHGKTTTTALLAFAFDQLAAAGSYAVGAGVPQLERHARFRPGADGVSPFFVIEADESDGTLRSFNPEHAIILNVDEEHLDFFANLEAICREFHQFAEKTTGKVFFCADDPHLAELFARRAGVMTFGFHDLAMYRIDRASIVHARFGSDAATEFDLWHAGKKLGRFSLRLMGEKNISNASAVIALLHQLGFSSTAIAAAIAPFRGASRRLQELFADGRFRVFDDYGHHPREIEATLRALKEQGARRLLVAFQPHRYSRTLHLLDEFSACFPEADRLWVTEIYAASEPEIPGINATMLVTAIRNAGQPAEYVGSLDDLGHQVREAMRPGDVVLFLGAGSITEAAHKLAEDLHQDIVMPKAEIFQELLRQLSPATVVRPDEPLARRTTLRVGGKADLYIEPASEADLAAALCFCTDHQIPFLFLGRGSNLLIRDGGIRGAVISLQHPNFSKIEIVEDRLHCGAGAKLKAVSVEARRHGLAGLEFLEGIPGSVGGGLRMNAGAMGSWTFEVVETLRFMSHTGEVAERRASEITVEYRGCPLLKNHVALGAVFKGERTPRERIEERLRLFNQKRWNSQPAAPSAGCIFKNPKTIPAGKLIDELGLKGTRVGGAVVSEVHGNFIVNDGNATAQDVLNLIEIIRERARTARGLNLETEVEILGEN